ncbi:hypothetical protein SNOG_03967 [Parastagonospora nodorum SN15]|uniref:Uncharacterized protein n=1 Tax=Phaeosphaeria nodorum (strain SN15 / ATCC MYA-4574 / FGSC 10173) TaxID=321614 RepID=Q0UW97_PHANO|nr:hypothetical protein SNOG_03967 [Parastagonospora nodorum SN15]EAT89172.1 hypothetical protein SNOG_03967 [Parastagonospora nodorum SN15]
MAEVSTMSEGSQLWQYLAERDRQSAPGAEGVNEVTAKMTS